MVSLDKDEAVSATTPSAIHFWLSFHPHNGGYLLTTIRCCQLQGPLKFQSLYSSRAQLVQRSCVVHAPVHVSSPDSISAAHAGSKIFLFKCGVGAGGDPRHRESSASLATPKKYDPTLSNIIHVILFPAALTRAPSAPIARTSAISVNSGRGGDWPSAFRTLPIWGSLRCSQNMVQTFPYRYQLSGWGSSVVCHFPIVACAKDLRSSSLLSCANELFSSISTKHLLTYLFVTFVLILYHFRICFSGQQALQDPRPNLITTGTPHFAARYPR